MAGKPVPGVDSGGRSGPVWSFRDADDSSMSASGATGEAEGRGASGSARAKVPRLAAKPEGSSAQRSGGTPVGGAGTPWESGSPGPSPGAARPADTPTSGAPGGAGGGPRPSPAPSLKRSRNDALESAHAEVEPGCHWGGPGSKRYLSQVMAHTLARLNVLAANEQAAALAQQHIGVAASACSTPGPLADIPGTPPSPAPLASPPPPTPTAQAASDATPPLPTAAPGGPEADAEMATPARSSKSGVLRARAIAGGLQTPPLSLTALARPNTMDGLPNSPTDPSPRTDLRRTALLRALHRSADRMETGRGPERATEPHDSDTPSSESEAGSPATSNRTTPRGIGSSPSDVSC